ncbi:MAG: hypothetical protein V4760_19605, partial [Bdellovibrionota bacterium]
MIRQVFTSSLVVATLATTMAREASAQKLELASFSGGADVAGFLAGGELRGGTEQFAKLSLVFAELQDLKR